MSGEFVAKADVSIRPLAEMKPVNPDVAVCHNAVEIKEHTPARVTPRQDEVFAIPADPGGQRNRLQRCLDSRHQRGLQCSSRGERSGYATWNRQTEFARRR